MDERQAQDMEEIIALLKNSLETDPDFGKNFDTTINQLTALLVNNGYCLDFFVSEKLQKEYAMSSGMIRIKQGNNGGYSMSYTHDGKVEVNLKIRLNGVQIHLLTTLDEIEGIAVTKTGHSGQFAVRFVDLFAVTRSLHFEQFFWSPSKQDQPAVEQKSSNVIDLDRLRSKKNKLRLVD